MTVAFHELSARMHRKFRKIMKENQVCHEQTLIYTANSL